MIYVVLLLALLLRLPLLSGSFWLDEAAQFLESARPLAQQLSIKDDFQPPLMHLLTFVSIRLGGLVNLDRTEWWLRLLPSLLPGIVTVYATYRLGLKLANRKVALLASLFLATSSLHIFYSQELRPYSLSAMFGILATWQLLTMLANQAKARPTHDKLTTKFAAKPALLFTLFSILGLYSSYLYPFLLIGQFVYLFYQKLPRQKILLLGSILILSFLPWLPKFFEQLNAGQALRLSMPGWDQVVSLPQLKTAFLVPLKFVFGVSDLTFNLPYILLTLAVFLPLTYFIYLAIKQNNLQLSFFLAILFLPLLLSWLVSFFVPILQAKRVLFLLPIFALLEALLINLNKKAHPHLAKIALSAILVINLTSTFAYWSKPQLQRENWRALSQEIAHKFPKNETALVFSFTAPFAPWEFYDQTNFQTFSTGVYYLNQLSDPQVLFKDLTNYHYVLVFDYLRDLTDPDNLLLQIVTDLGFREFGVLDYPQIGFVRIYSLSNFALK